MELNVDIEKLINKRMGIGEYLLYWLIYNGESQLFYGYYNLDNPWGSISDLFQYGYVEVIDNNKPNGFSNLRVTNKFIEEYIQDDIKKVKNNVSEWIDEWYDLFPKGIKVFGYLVRSDKNGCLRKMKDFIKLNPQFSKEIILKATKNFIDYCKLNNYSSIQMAHYFISKDKISNLAGYCEAVKDKLDSGKITKEDLSLGLNTEQEYSFDKSINI
jgi:hypothetical protein